MELMDPLPALAGVATVVGGALWWLRRKVSVLRIVSRSGARNSRRLQKLEGLVFGPHHALHLVRLDDRMILVAQSPDGLALLEESAAGERSFAALAARSSREQRG